MRNLLLLAFIAFNALYANDYLVGGFCDATDYPGEPDNFIAAEFNNELRSANPSSIQDGSFYLRQKFEDPFEDDIDYCFYQGRATTSKSLLNKFTTSKVPYSALTKAKVYINKGAAYDEDLEKVYFDGQAIFVEGEKFIYVQHNGEMIALEASEEREVFIEMSSQPQGAEVIVDGEKRGVTPLKFSVASTQPVMVLLKKKGHYDVIRMVNPLVGRVAQDGALLLPKEELTDPTQNFKARLLQAKQQNNSAMLLKLKSDIDASLETWPTTAEQQIEAIMNKYPPNPGKKASESAEEFDKREALWKKSRADEEKSLNASIDDVITGLQAMQKDLDTSLEDVYFSLVYKSFGTKDIQVGSITGNKAQLTLTSLDPKARFTAKGTYTINESKAAFTEKVENNRLYAVAKAWNLKNTNGNLVAIHDVAFFVNKEPLQPVGEATITVANANTPADKELQQKGVAFDTRVNDLTGSNLQNWVSKDKTRTQEELEKVYTEMEVEEEIEEAPPVVAYVETQEEPEYEEEAEEEEAEEYDYEYSEYEEEDEAAYEAANAASRIDDEFDKTDEYMKALAWTFTGIAIISGGMMVYQNMGYNEAKTAYDETKTQMDVLQGQIATACEAYPGNPSCIAALEQDSRENGALGILEPWHKTNESTMNSYLNARNLWAGATAVSAIGATLLFTIDF